DAAPRGGAAPLSADDARDRLGALDHDVLPAADGSLRPAAAGVRKGRGRPEGLSELRVSDDGLGHPGRALAGARRPKEDTGHGDSFAVGQSLVRALIDLSQIQRNARAAVGLQLHRVTGDPLDVAVNSKALLAVARNRIDHQA